MSNQEVLPLVSVLMPAYNHESYIEEAISSVLNQTYPNIELIVIDDKSQDRTPKIARCLFEKNPDKIRFLEHQYNKGIVSTFNDALTFVRGSFVAPHASDDVIPATGIYDRVKYMLKNTDIDVLITDFELIDSDNKIHKGMEKYKIVPQFKKLCSFNPQFVYEQLVLGNFIPSGASLIRLSRIKIEDIVQDARVPSLSDYDMWMNLAKNFKWGYLNKSTWVYRWHGGNMSTPTIENIRKSIEEKIYILSKNILCGYEKKYYSLTINSIRTSCEMLEQIKDNHTSVAPESLYATWRDRHRWSASAVARLAEQVAPLLESGVGVHLLMVAAAGESNALADTIDTLAAQGSPGWRLTVFSPDPCPNSLFETVPILAWVRITTAEELPSVLGRTIKSSPVDWLMVCAPGIRLESPFVSLVLAAARQNPDWRCIYFDEERFNCEGQPIEPRLKPDANLELLRSSAYVGQAVLVHRELCSVLDYRLAALPRAFAFDAALRAVEAGGEAALGHVDELAVALPEMADGTVEDWVPLAKGLLEAHLARLNELAEVRSGLLPDTFFLDYPLTRRPLVSVIVPTKDRLDLLKPCLDSLLEKTEYREFEVLIVDNASTDRATLDYLKTLARQNSRVKILPYAAPYNFSAINNMAAKAASGEFLVLLNNDTVVIQPNWLDRMLAHGLRESVGIVGCRLLYPNGSVQHAGVILGLSGVADHIGVDLPMEAPGYSSRAQQTQNFSAVTAACMLIRRDLYRELGGMDTECFPVSYNDVDLCLKVRARGLSVVWTPFATLVHCAGSSRSTNKPQQINSERRSGYELARKWLSWLSDDPAYNRHLSLVARNWSLDSLSVPWSPRFDVLPRVLADPCDTWGIGHYRVRDPLSTLDAAGIAQYALLPNHEQYYHKLLEPIILERTGADTFLFQNAFHGEYLSGLETIRKTLPNRRIVFGQDDIPFAVPPRSAAYKRVPKDAKKNLRRTLSFCDRLVVSNPELANAFRSMIKDIRVVPNYLPRWRWEGLASQRRRSSRPRVGWAGGVDHQGDLEFMLPVVETTHKEVDWVFMGMCPDKIRPLIAEFHQGVPFADYPAALANLDLDLAVAPLELNQFNAAKSNLRLLEYGVLGWPVVCTDIEPYRSAPVCRLPNNPRAWIEAIRERVHDLPAAQREGDALQVWVRDHWMLEDHLEEWRQALLEW